MNVGQANSLSQPLKSLTNSQPHNARTSAISITTGKQHLQNGLDINWNHKGMTLKKQGPLLLPNLVN